MSAPGSSDVLGQSQFTDFDKFKFAVPCTQPPPEDGGLPVPAGFKTDMGALVLFLVSNWFVNGETVLIDGGVSACLPSSLKFCFLETHLLVIADSAITSLVLLKRQFST